MLDNLSIKILEYLVPQFESEVTPNINVLTLSETFTEYSPIQIESCLRELSDNKYIEVAPVINARLIVRKLTNKGFSFKDPAYQVKPAQQTFNINSVSNSAFGNNGNVTLNIGSTFTELKDFVKSQDIPQSDKDTLLEMTTQVETMIENEIPLKKGFLNKFKNVVGNYDGYIIAISQLLFSYFTGNNQAPPM